MTDQELKEVAIKLANLAFRLECKEDVDNFDKELFNELKKVRDAQYAMMNWVKNEIQCRIEHGAESNGHLEGLLKLIEERK